MDYTQPDERSTTGDPTSNPDDALFHLMGLTDLLTHTTFRNRLQEVADRLEECVKSGNPFLRLGPGQQEALLALLAEVLDEEDLNDDEADTASEGIIKEE